MEEGFAFQQLLATAQSWLSAIGLGVVTVYPVVLLVWMIVEGSVAARRANTPTECEEAEALREGKALNLEQGSKEEDECAKPRVDGTLRAGHIRFSRLLQVSIASLSFFLVLAAGAWMLIRREGNLVGSAHHEVARQLFAIDEDLQSAAAAAAKDFVNGTDLRLPSRIALPHQDPEVNVAVESARAQSSPPEGMFAEWLYNLKINIPEIEKDIGPEHIKISDGVCRHLRVTGIQMKPMTKLGVNIQASGLAINCSFNWDFQGIITHLSGGMEVVIGDSTIGGPLEIISDGGQPPLPSGLHAEPGGCNGDFKIKDWSFTGGFSTILNLLKGIIQPFLVSSLPSIICSNVDKAINDKASKSLEKASVWLRKKMEEGSEAPLNPPSLPKEAQDYVDFSSNPGLKALNELLDKVLNNPASPHNLKDLIPKGTVSLLMAPLTEVFVVKEFATFNITLFALDLWGIDNITDVGLNAPQQQTLSGNLGMQDISVKVSAQLTVTPDKKFPVQGTTLTESFNASFGLDQLSAGAAMFLGMEKAAFTNLAANQLMSAGCLVKGVPAAEALSLGLMVGAIHFVLSPLTSDSLVHDLDAMITAVVQLVLKQFDVTVPVLVNHLVAVTARDSLNTKVEEVLATPSTCEAAESTYTNFTLSDGAFWVSMLLAIGGFIGIALAMKLMRKNRQHGGPSPPTQPTIVEEHPSVVKADEASTSSTPSTTAVPSRDSSLVGPSRESSIMASGPSSVEPRAGAADPGSAGSEWRSQRPAFLQTPLEPTPASGIAPATFASAASGAPTFAGAGTQKWDSLALHPRIPRALTYGIPVLILATIVLFISSNSGTGVSIMVSILADGKSVVELPPVKRFSLLSTFVEMWDAEVYALGFVIVLFSGVWPYTKLLLMLFCWAAPSKTLSVRWRQNMVQALDAFGKWSLVDCFVMVLFMVAFRLQIEPSLNKTVSAIFDEAGITGEVTVWVRPDLGIHTFLIGTVASLLIGHLLSAAHRYALQIGEFGIEQASASGKRRLCDILEPTGTQLTKLIPVAVCCLSVCLLLIGVFVDTFQFEFLGLAGWILGDDERIRPFSVASLSGAVPASNPSPNSFGVRWLQSLFILFTMVMPLVSSIIFLVLWMVPLTNSVQRKLYVTSEVFSAWAGLDVFVLSICASVLEIQQFANFIIGSKCDAVNHILEKSSLAPQIPGPKTCFDVKATLGNGFWILLPSAVLATVVSSWLLHKCSAALCKPPSAQNQAGNQDGAGVANQVQLPEEAS